MLMNLCVCLCMGVYMSEYAHVCVHVCVCARVGAHVSLYMYVCLYNINVYYT